MTTFRCLGSSCEDDCCHGWSIFVDEPHYEKLIARGGAEVGARIRPIEGGGRHRFALVTLDAGGRCAFHDEERLCSLQRRYGEEVLPDGCASYPRVIGRIGRSYELLGAVSCPEVARLVLAGEDAQDLVPGSREHFARGVVSHRVELESEDGYERAFPSVRALLMELLARRRYPIASRLFILAFIADLTRAELRSGGPGLTPEALAELGSAARTEANLDRLHEQLHQLAPQPAYALSVVRTVLHLPAKLVPPALGELAAAVSDLLPEDGSCVAWSSLPPPAPWLEERLDDWLTRVAVHYLQREWFVRAPSLALYVHGLLVRIAALRVLIRGNPGVRAAAAASPEVEAVAVRAVYSLSRLLEHNRALADGLLADLEAQGMTTLDHAACLAQLLR